MPSPQPVKMVLLDTVAVCVTPALELEESILMARCERRPDDALDDAEALEATGADEELETMGAGEEEEAEDVVGSGGAA